MANKMSDIQYVIRQRNFFYNDEGQYLTHPEFDGYEGYGDIEHIENSLGLAQQHCEIKNIQFMRNAELSMYCPPCENHTHNHPSDEFKIELEALLQQYGHHLCTPDGSLIQFLPADLPDDAVLKFAKIVNILAYEVLEFKQDEKLYAIWLFKEQKYFGYTKILTYANPDYFALAGTYLLTDKLFISGSVSELSDTPELLNALIQNNSEFFKYQMNPEGILIESVDVAFEDLSALNSLLKQPLFEIRPINLEQLHTLNHGE